jgi:hypothetical protein
MTYQIAFQAEVWRMIRNVMTIADPYYDGRVFYAVAPRDVDFPLFVYQSQDLGGANYDSIGANGWRGLVALRSIATDADVAATLLGQVLLQLQNSITTSGITTSGLFDVSIRPMYPIQMPVESLSDVDLIITSAVVAEVVITPLT